MISCGTCGFPGYRPGDHADWCWTADPTQPNLGGDDRRARWTVWDLVTHGIGVRKVPA